MGFGEGASVWPLLAHSQNPSLRSFLIERLARLGADHRILADRLEKESEPSIRQALVLALGDFDAGKFSEEERQTLVNRLSALYHNDPDSGVHSAAEWTLRQYEGRETVARLDADLQRTELHGAELDGAEQKLSAKDSRTARHWFINSQGQTFIVVDGPVSSRRGEERRPNDRLAMATHEVTVVQFKRFTAGYWSKPAYRPAPDCPAIAVTWFGAAAYCNWLSRQDGIPKEEWCYEPNAHGKYAAGMKIRENFLRRTGYRLPTKDEWKYVCHANTDTTFSFGEPMELLDRYALVHRQLRTADTWPVGSLRPNDLGVFDMYGNVWEWCQDRFKQNGQRAGGESETVESDWSKGDPDRLLEGSGFDNRSEDFRTHLDVGDGGGPDGVGFSLGFRPVRTYR